MTGLEKLRAICGLYYLMGGGVQPVAIGKLKEIADQIERETLPRPLFEDGEPVQFGDECAFAGGVEAVHSIAFYGDGRWHVFGRGVYGTNSVDGPLRRPEPTDTWERLECDVDTGSGFYDMDKAEAMEEVLRRCKALAGVE